MSISPVLIRARVEADRTESEGRLSSDLVADLASSGVFKLWVPRAYGGAGATLAEGLAATEEGAFHDGATGWSIMIANTTALLSASLGPVQGAAIFGADDAICGGFAAPVGVGQVVGGQLEVSGRWAWGSGSSHATTMGGGVRIVDADGKPATLPNGSGYVFAFFESDEVELLDTWQVAGLQGTASTDYRVENARVPFDRLVAMDQRQLVVDDTLYRFSTFGALALGVAMVGLGLARRAIEELLTYAAKVPQGSSRSLAERPAVQADLARADASIRAARAGVDSVVAEAWEIAHHEPRLPDEHKLRLRAAANHAMDASVSIVDRCYSAAGGAAVYRAAPIQRVFRDVHVARQHAMVAPRIYEPLGRALFGLPTDTRSL